MMRSRVAYEAGTSVVVLILVVALGGCDMAPEDGGLKTDAGLTSPVAADDAAQETADPRPCVASVIVADLAAYPFEAQVGSADVVVTGRIEAVDPVTTWSTPNGRLEGSMCGDHGAGPEAEWQEVTVVVDRVLVDTRSVVSDEPLLVRYQVVQPVYEAIDPGLEGAAVFVCAEFYGTEYTDGSVRELLFVREQATYIEADSGEMVRLFSVLSGARFATLAADSTLRRSDADAVDMAELIDRVEHPRPKSEWLGAGDPYGDPYFPEEAPPNDPDAVLIVP